MDLRKNERRRQPNFQLLGASAWPVQAAGRLKSKFQIFPSVRNLRNLQIFFADTRNLWFTRLYWSAATAAGAIYTTLDCTSAVQGTLSAAGMGVPNDAPYRPPHLSVDLFAPPTQ